MSPLEFQRPDQASSGSPRTYSAVQTFFLRRLERLVRVDRDLATSLSPDDWRLRLLRRSTYATYYECLELGLGEEARQVLSTSSKN
ncbi:hypothetical protein FJZ55_10370 [Candidatus Woesearchaeota archaeon]|nr:hypothetical protein [Candidatus Woesearchaeota archaeon]